MALQQKGHRDGRKEGEMEAPAHLPLPFFFLCFLILFSSCNGADRLWENCSADKNTTGTTSANIAHVLMVLVSKGSSDGFATTSYGDGTGERVYGLAQCRGDVSAADCRACVSDAASQLPDRCPDQAEARIWFDYCFLRYDTRNFVGELDAGYGLFYINTENVTQNATELERFEVELGKLLRRVQAQAVGRQNKGLGKVEAVFTPFVTIYALGQCTRDLPPLACAQCISIAVANMPNFCRYRKGCRALYSSCYVRYEIYPFFFPLGSTRSSAIVASTTVVVYP